MQAEIRSDRLHLRFDPYFRGGAVEARHRQTGEASALAATWEEAGADEAAFSIAIADYNAATHALVVGDGSWEIDLDPALERFRLDLARIDDHGYMSRTVFDPGQRGLAPDDLLYLLLCHLEAIDPENQFYGGLITVLSFRIADGLEARARLAPRLVEAWWRMVETQSRRADHSVRWRISSAVNLSILLLYLGREEEAAEIVEAAAAQAQFNAMFPLTFMNQAALLALAGMVALDRGDRDQAYLRFTECAGLCNTATADLFSLRNNFFFQHEQDVRTLVDIGYQAAIAMAGLSGPRHPGDGKMTMNVQAAPLGRLGFAPVFGRFRSILGGLPALADRAAEAVRAHAAAR